jgi:hypothetical protein
MYETTVHGGLNRELILTTRRCSVQVCLVDGIELTGIALSRVMGDTWAFKKEVDTILERMKL